MPERLDFQRRIAEAIMQGRRRTSWPISFQEAWDRAWQVANALPGLFRKDVIELRER